MSLHALVEQQDQLLASDEVHDVISEFKELMVNIEIQFSDDAEEKKSHHYLKDKIQVQAQKGREFVQDGLEWDETKKDKLPCPCCSHHSVLIVNSDDKNKTATNLEAAMVYGQTKRSQAKWSQG